MIWLLLLLFIPEPVTVYPPAAMDRENWDEWHECFTDPGWPIQSCEQTVTVEWSTHSPPAERTSGYWCWVHDYSYHDPPHKNTNPWCLVFDHDGDFDVDIADYAIWQRKHIPDEEPFDTGQVILSFCRFGGCWTVFFQEVDGVMQAGLVKHPSPGD